VTENGTFDAFKWIYFPRNKIAKKLNSLDIFQRLKLTFEELLQHTPGVNFINVLLTFRTNVVSAALSS